MTTQFAPTKAFLKAHMDSMLVGKTSLSADEQARFDNVLEAVKILDQAGTATMTGVDRRTTRLTQSQSEYEAGGGDAAATATETATPVAKPGPRHAVELFGGPATKPTFKSLEHFAWCLANGSSEIRMANGASAGTPSDGGYSIPMAYAYEMLDIGLESEIVRPRARTEGMDYAQKIITTFDGSTHASGLVSGLTLQWIAEGGDISYQVPKLRQIQLQAKKAVIMVPSTNELLQDSPNFGAGLGPLMQQALSFGLDRSFLIGGAGAGQPLSALNATSTITVSKATGQPAATIVYDNIVGMLARLHPACYANAVWIFHPSCLTQLLQLAIPVGMGGEVVPVMSSIAGQYSMLGRPVILSEKMQPLGTAGDCMLVDLSQYIIGIQKNGFRLDQSSHLLFKSDETVFRLIVRIEGQPIWAKAFQPLNSASTLSWCVTLAART